MAEGKKECYIKARLTAKEFQQLLAIEKTSGMTRTELIRRSLFSGTTAPVNSRELRARLDEIGRELGRSGNNLNQLARHANTLRLRGQLSEPVIMEFLILFRQYAAIRRDTEQALRALIRLLRA